jgi:hypothetical protein
MPPFIRNFCLIATLVGTLPVTAAAAPKQTLGFVLTGWHLAVHESPDGREECPAGFQYSNLDNWKAEYPTEAEREKMHQEYGFRQNRGQNGENVWLYPDTVTDPLPFREVQSSIGVGANLDGTEDGAATPKSCAHQKFVSPEGQKGIDNQLYRVLGCQKPFRRGGMFDARFSNEKKVEPFARFLVEISDIDNLQNDDSVIVTTFKGSDKLVADAAGNVIPFSSQRVDERGPQYIHRTRGRIVNGVLYTEPMDILFAAAPHGFPSETYLQDMRLQLKLGETSAEGLMAGYHDLKQWWKAFVKQTMSLEHVTQISAPGVYQAIVRLADGHKDATTGQCQSISAAYEVSFVRAFIVHTEPKAQVAAAANLK